jgi:hypothetical protein
MAVVPSIVLCSPRSSRMRASTGNAVMLIAIPRKRTKGTLPIPRGANRMRSECASSAPIENGSRMLVALATTAVRRWW